VVESKLRVLYRRLGAVYPSLFIAATLQASWPIALATIGFLRLYVPMSGRELAGFVTLTMAGTGLSIAFAAWHAHRILAPVRRWIEGERGRTASVAAWRCAVGLPVRFWRRGWYLLPLLTVAAPWALGAALILDAEPAEAIFVPAVAAVSIGYAAILYFFVVEAGMRPVIAEIAAGLPAGIGIGATAIPLRLKLLGVLPAINLIAGLLAAGLASSEHEISALGIDVLASVLATFATSLVLTMLLARSLRQPLVQLLDATNRVRGGDLDTELAITSSDEVGELAVSFNQMIAGLRQRERLRSTLSTYLDPAIAARLVDEGDGAAGGKEAEASMLVLDVRGFSAFAAARSPREVVAALNGLYELAVPIISGHGGHVDKFVGDGLLAIFGAPIPEADHADRALMSAVQIVQELEQRRVGPLEIGIGISSGKVLVGSVGGGGRLDFTAIGDAVNVASRVEAATRVTGDPILLSEATKRLLRHSPVELDERPAVSAKGGESVTRVYVPRVC
jgi:adenylate cyclase